MATNDFLQFGNTGVVGTDILSQVNYASDTQRPTGHQPGLARAVLENKVLLQTSSIAAMIGQFMADYQLNNVGDSVSIANLEAYFKTAIRPGGGVLSFSVVNSNTTLVGANVVGTVVQASGITYTITLPLVSELPVGSSFYIMCTGSGTVTVQRQGSDQLYFNLNSLTTSTTISAGDVIKITKFDGTAWTVDGSKALATYPQFAAVLSGNGYQKLPSGMILQWGQTTFAGVSGNVTFNINFASNCDFFIAADVGSTAPYQGCSGALTVSTANGVTFGTTPSTFYWFALGH